MAGFKTTENSVDKFHEIINWKKNNREAKDILDLNNDFDLNILKKAYKKKALEFHPDKNPTRNIDATNAFKIITDAYHYMLYTKFRQKFEEDFGINAISNNIFFPQNTESSNKQAFKASFYKFLNEFRSRNQGFIELLDELLKQDKQRFVTLFMHYKNDFVEFLKLLQNKNASVFSKNWELYFELAIRHKITNHHDYFQSYRLDIKKEIVKKILQKTTYLNTELLKFITKEFSFTNEELLNLISYNNSLAEHYKSFMPKAASTAEKLQLAIRIVKKSPGAYRFLNYEDAQNIEIIAHAFKNPDNSALFENLMHLRDAKSSSNGIASNIFYAIINTFPHIKDYEDLDKVFSGPREPLYTYLKCFAAVCPLIVAGTVLLILYVSALLATPELALFACIPAILSTTVLSLFTYDYIMVKSYEYKISRISKDSCVEETTNQSLVTEEPLTDSFGYR